MHYVRGTLVIDMLERESDTVVWHGWISTEIFKDTDTEKRSEAVVKAVMKNFPPKQKK